MTIAEAYQILGLSPKAAPDEIKKKYRELMRRMHPDARIGSEGKSSDQARELNRAYQILKERRSCPVYGEKRRKKSGRPKPKPAGLWHAPVNEQAYREREILQYAEDRAGTVLGNFRVAKGKYLWTTDEEFPLFLLSLYRCGKQILDETDARLFRKEPPPGRPLIQAELTYLLARQFIDQAGLLPKIAREEEPDAEGNRVFYIPSMLEVSHPPFPLKPEETLYPSGIRSHRLYLKNQAGKEAGYLSFPDDRLYYIVVPLLEQKAVRVRIQAAERQPKKRKPAAAGYQNLHLWIKWSESTPKSLPQDLNLQIEQLLTKYRQFPSATAPETPRTTDTPPSAPDPLQFEAADYIWPSGPNGRARRS